MDRELQASGFKPLWVLEMAGLSRVYRMGRTEVYAVRGVSLRVATGEFVALMGPSGSGKSTLMHLLGCLETPTAGTYKLEGQDVGKLSSDERARVRNDRIGFVFQTFNLMTHLKALDNVALPLLYRGRVKSVKARAAEALAQVRPGRPRTPSPCGALRRRAAACRHCACPGRRPRHHPGGRTHRKPGYGHRERHHAAADRAAPQGAHHRAGHSRPPGSGARPTDRPYAGWPNHQRGARRCLLLTRCSQLCEA